MQRIVRVRRDLDNAVARSAGAIELDGDLTGTQPGKLAGSLRWFDMECFELHEVVCRKGHDSLWGVEGLNRYLVTTLLK
jgi:hypothetical protein